MNVPACGAAAGDARPRRWTPSSTRRGTSCATATRRRRGAVRPVVVDYWNPVDLFIGGVDHATMHMIYARFWVKVLNDLGLVGFREPFELLSNGWVTIGSRRSPKPWEDSSTPTSWSSATAQTRCGSASSSWRPWDQDMEWTEEASRGCVRGCGGCRRPSGGRAAAAQGAGERRSRRKAPDDRQGHGRHRAAPRSTPDLRGDGATNEIPGQLLQAPWPGRRSLCSIPCAPHVPRNCGSGSGANGSGKRLAGAPRAARARDVRARRPGQRQGARPDRGGRPSPRTVGRTAKASPKVQAHVDGKAVHASGRRAAQARQPRRRLAPGHPARRPGPAWGALRIIVNVARHGTHGAHAARAALSSSGC